VQARQDFSVQNVCFHIISDMAKAVSERAGEGQQTQYTRAGVAAAMIADLNPQDTLQAMLAGHCVMFHELLNDSVQDTLRGEKDARRRGTRGNIVAMNHAFHANLNCLERRQNRPAEAREDALAEAAPAAEDTIQPAETAADAPSARYETAETQAVAEEAQVLAETQPGAATQIHQSRNAPEGRRMGQAAGQPLDNLENGTPDSERVAAALAALAGAIVKPAAPSSA